ncbi:MAG: diaminopimelate epimerase [Chitinophagales bacterium]|jgi:diaminopimelate epimerase
MHLEFFKYQGAGNDFVMIDNRQTGFPKENQSLIERLCDRRYGVGADGLILLENADGADFKMVYFNADGRESSMCGNGGRCIVAFAKQLGIIQSQANFIAIDGLHRAEIKKGGRVALGMNDVNEIEGLGNNHFVLDTGSPHYVVVGNEMPDEFVDAARAIRYNERFKEEGINVNFITVSKDEVKIRTYERGVEDETLACGTGAVAAAMVATKFSPGTRYKIQTQGGMLEVSFSSSLNNIILEGDAVLVFSGSQEIDSV